MIEKHAGAATVLIMDDEPMIRNLLGIMARKLGYEPSFAKDGEEAIVSLTQACKKNKPFDCVILDLTLPTGLPGKEAVKELLEIDPNVKAIACTGYSNDPVMTDCEAYGFSGALPKPFRLEQLGQLLAEVPGRKPNEVLCRKK